MGFPSWRQTVAWHGPLHPSSHHARLTLDLTSTLSYQPIYLLSLKGAIYSISPLLYPFLNLLHLGFHPSLVLMLNLPSMAKCTGCPQDFILLHTLDCPLSMKHCVFIELYSGLISSFCDSGSLSLMMPLDCTHGPYPLPRNSVQMSLIAKFLAWVSLKCEHHLSVYLLDRCLQIHIPQMSLLYSPKFSNFNSNLIFYLFRPKD